MAEKAMGDIRGLLNVERPECAECFAKVDNGCIALCRHTKRNPCPFFKNKKDYNLALALLQVEEYRVWYEETKRAEKEAKNGRPSV